MKLGKTLQTIAAISITTSSAIAFNNQLTQAAPTTFRCIPFNNTYATVAIAHGKQTKPLIIYTYATTRYTRKDRCDVVSARLNVAVANNGGRLSNLLLTTGTVNNSNVICYVNDILGFRSSCDSQNMLVTLPPRVAPGEALATFLNVRANHVSASPLLAFDDGLVVSEGTGIGEPQEYLEFGQAVEEQLGIAEQTNPTHQQDDLPSENESENFDI